MRKKYSILKNTLPIQFLNIDVDGCALVDRIARVACTLCNTCEIKLTNWYIWDVSLVLPSCTLTGCKL